MAGRATTSYRIRSTNGIMSALSMLRQRARSPQEADDRGAAKRSHQNLMRFHHALALVLGTSCLNACMPLPVRYHTQPDIYGTVTRNGVPVQGAKIGYSTDLTDSHCDSPVDTHPTTVVSEPNGTFHFDGTYSFFQIIYWKPHSSESVNGRICIDTSDGQRFSQQLSIPGGNTVSSIPDNASCAQLVINCDLAQNQCTGTAQ
jgi:hypothetical protein